MQTTTPLAIKLENCIKQSHLQFTNQHPQGTYLEIGSGAAFFSGSNSFFSQVVGWGFGTEQTFSAEIETIESFYRQHQHEQVDIELCPLVAGNIENQLIQRGYFVSERNNISIRNLSNYQATTVIDNGYAISKVRDNNLSAWAHCVASGFDVTDEWKQFYYYAKAAGVTAFGAYINDSLAAGGTIAIHDKICDLGVTSTLPEHRGHGLQKALLNKRIEYAIGTGATVAVVTTEPESISDLNIQKLGFQLVYTRTKYTLPLVYS